MTQSTSFAQMANNQSISLSSALRANTPPAKGQTTSRKFLILSIFLLLSFFTTNAWGAVISENTYSTASSMPTGWSKNGDYNNDSYLKLVASTNYIQTDAFCVKSFSSIKLKARKFGGPSASQAEITIEWIVGNNSISLGSITPTSTTLTDYIISSPTAVSADNEGYIKISCKNASDSKGSGVSAVTITYTSGNCSDSGNTGDGDDSGDTSCLTLSATSNYPFNSTSSTNTSVYSTTIDGITFENKGGYKYNSYLSFNRSLSGAYIANTTPFSGNIESIVVDYNSGGSSYFNMYEGSASKPSSTVVSPSVTGTGSVTYTFSGNNPYFNLALKTTGDYCNINSITICYSNTPASSFTVTATSNNNTYGTVSVSGTTITATPKTGYRVSTTTPYTISPSGSATVSQDGNTFSVTPSSDCTITINFEAIPQNTVKWSIKGNVTTTTLSNGTTTMPADPTGVDASCGTKTFVGWSNAEVTDGNKPTILFKKADGIPNTINLTNGTTFYAVYADSRTTTSITYTWDLLKQSITPALAVGDQIVIAAKYYDYALSTKQNRNVRGAVEITKHSTGDSITINNNVQIITLQKWDASDERFVLSVGASQYLSGAKEKFTTSTKNSNNTNWYMGFNSEYSPYIYTQVEEGGRRATVNEYYIQYWSFYGIYSSFDVSKNNDPENISIYRRTKHENTTTVNSGYTTDCGCTAPANSLAFSDQTITADQTLILAPNTGGNGGTITYTCSDATHTTITDGHIFSANALDTYTITATQGVNGDQCGAIVDFEVTVKCATPSITPTTHSTTINTPVDLKSIIISTSTMPLSFAYTGKNVYISGTNFTFLAAGTYTINATQAAGGIYCDGSQEITITVTDPCAGKEKPSVTEGTITTDGFTLSWSEITGVSTYRIYNNTTGDSDETTDTSYTFSGLNPSTEYSWTVEAVYSDGCTAATSGTTTTSTPEVTYTVNWYVAGEPYTTYGGSTSVIHGKQVSSLPTPPVPAAHACDGKAFVGWTTSQHVNGSKPAVLFTDVDGSPAITAATTFYAVFADCVTDGGDDTPEDDTQGEWTLVTDMSVLEVGTKIFIAAAEEDLSLSTTQNNNNRAATSIIKSGNTATIDEATQVLTLETGKTNGTWAFNTGSGYLYAASSGSNYLRTQTELDDNGSWTISVTNIGIATIKAQGSNTRNWLRKNSNSALFSCYSSGQDDVVIYYKSAESTPVDPTEYTVTLSVLGETSEENTTSNYTLPIDVDASCAGKTFVGWTTTANLSSPTEPTSDYWAKGTPVTITEDKTYYAVFAEGTNTFEWVTTGVESGADYLLAGYDDGNDYVLKNTLDSYGYIETVNINAIDNVITTSDNSLIWTIAGNSTLGYYIYNPASDKYLNIDAPFTLDGTAKTRYSITMSKDAYNYVQSYIKYGNDYCYLYNDNTIGIDETEASIYLYKRAYSDYSTTCESGGADPDPETTYTVSFNAGTGTCTTQSLTETSEGAGVTLPTATGCGDWTFAGWATASVTETTTAPTLLAAGNNYKPNSNTTLYAVYSKAESGGGGGGGTLTISSNSMGTSTSYGSDDFEVDGVTFKRSSWGKQQNGSNYYLQGKTNNAFYNEDPIPGAITKIVVDCYGGTGTLYIGTSKTPTSNEQTIDSDETFNFAENNNYQYIRVYSTSTLKITSITITYAASGSSTTYYNSNPDCGGADPDPDPEPTGTEYVKVTDASSLKAGDKLLLVNESKAVVAGNITDQYMAKVNATISNNTISELPNNAVVLTLGGTAGAWTLANSEGKFLGATAEKKLAWDGGTTTWTISISNGDATIQNGTNSYGRFLYNVGSPRFTTYSSSVSASMLLPQIYKLTSTPASAPARKVAMKKTAAKAAKKAGMARPVVKAPAALAAQECTSYENYTTICCANPITDLKYSAGANSITLYWNTAAASATATLYNDEECTSQVTGATQSGITNGTCTFTGLAKTTTYYAKVTTTDGCTAVLEVSTERPIVSVAEWAATQINIDINTNEPIRVYLENEVTGGSTSGNQATELFFSKYYEATANVKLVAVYNGTPDAINLSTYTIQYGKTAWATNYIPLAEFATTANGFAIEGYLSPGEEMILYTKNVSDGRDVAIMECVNEAYPDGKWIEVTTTNNTGKGSLSFGGDKVIALFDGTDLIDIIGAGNASAPTISGSSMTKPSWGDAKGWTCDEGLSIDDGTMIGISTNRCLLVRNNTVTSGENAVSQNTSDFVTLCTEWKGAHVPDDDIDDGVAASCENFAFVGTFDYSDYYVKYEEFGEEQELPADGRLEDGTYKVTTPDLHDIACTNMRISVKSATDGTTLVTQDYKVPIIVDQDIQTDNEIYFQYTQRTDVNVEPDLGDKNENVLTPDICAECDIVIRDSKTLTHVEGGKGQFRNMMVYPNAKMDNQAEQPFNLNTLQMQGKNDEVSYAIIENDGSTIDVGDMVFVKRIDDKYWYNFSLPYDCKVADIIQQNGQSMGKYWVDWGIKEYDGKARQAEGNSAGAGNVGLYWKKVEETATLKAHQGYIIGLFTTEWTNQMKFVYFTPTNTNPYRESGDDEKNTTIDSWYTTNKATVAARHRGWNFTGSPYISRFGETEQNQGLNTSLIMKGMPLPENSNETSYTTYTENVYVTIPSTQGGKYYSHSVASGVELLPFTAYFVQAADVDGSTDTPRTLTYAKGNRALPASAPARTPAATKQRVLAELLVTAPDGQTDNTGVWVDERYTPEYEIAADLGKMYVAGAKPQLYTLAANGDMMAYHALPDASAMNIPLRLYAPKAGDYTLTLNQRVSRLAGAERVELLYNNAVVANMMLQDYTITANRGTVNGYSLSITRRADVSTAIDNITGTAITVIANDGYISVTDIPTDAQVSVYDMLGRLLATQSANGQTVVNIPAVPQGVYNIVVGNNNGHTTIKTVIK